MTLAVRGLGVGMRQVDATHGERTAVEGCARALGEAFGEPPDLAMVLGSGLGPVVDALSNPMRVPYVDLGLPDSRVVGHAGVAVLGELEGRRVLLLSGRVHRYEGGPEQELVRCVRALNAWGVPRILLTCSVGGLHPHLPPGTLVRVVDHLNFQGTNPLIGPAYGQRFPDLQEAYDPVFGQVLDVASEREEIDLPTGVLAAMTGPAYESPAEVRMLRLVGADVVGMSTVPEVLACAALGQPVAVVAVVSNFASGVVPGAVDHASVTAVAARAATDLVRLLRRALRMGAF